MNEVNWEEEMLGEIKQFGAEEFSCVCDFEVKYHIIRYLSKANSDYMYTWSHINQYGDKQTETNSVSAAPVLVGTAGVE